MMLQESGVKIWRPRQVRVLSRRLGKPIDITVRFTLAQASEIMFPLRNDQLFGG
jgi:hypothetical protein